MKNLYSDSEEDPEEEYNMLPINIKKAKEYYEEAGKIVAEKDVETEVTGDKFAEESNMVNKVIQTANLHFTLDYFQKIALCALASVIWLRQYTTYSS